MKKIKMMIKPMFDVKYIFVYLYFLCYRYECTFNITNKLF